MGAGIRAGIFLTILGIIVLIGLIAFPLSTTGRSRWDGLAFSGHKNALKFFDHETGRIYVYDEKRGKLNKVWQLEGLGKDLKKIPLR